MIVFPGNIVWPSSFSGVSGRIAAWGRSHAKGGKEGRKREQRETRRRRHRHCFLLLQDNKSLRGRGGGGGTLCRQHDNELPGKRKGGEAVSVYDDRERKSRKLIEAKELLNTRIDNPPTIVELSKLTGINEYKLKKGFKELFGTTIFGYIHHSRMSLAKRLLLGTDKSAKEIAYETGYSSPQHFSNAFKKQFGITPNNVRNNPDAAIE